MVKQNLIDRFKFDSETIAWLFFGNTVTIQNHIVLETAKKYRAAFKNSRTQQALISIMNTCKEALDTMLV